MGLMSSILTIIKLGVAVFVALFLTVFAVFLVTFNPFMPRELREHDEPTTKEPQDPRTPRLDELTEDSSYEEITACLEHELAINPPTQDELTTIETHIAEIDNDEARPENEPSTIQLTEPIETSHPPEPRESPAQILGIHEQETNDHQSLTEYENPIDEHKHINPHQPQLETLEINKHTLIETETLPEEATTRVESFASTLERPFHNFREWFNNPDSTDIPIHPDSKAAIDEMIERHTYFKDRESFQEKYRHAQWYIVLKDSQSNDDLPDASSTKLGQRIGVSESGVYCWLKDKHTPALIRDLLIHEKARCYHEAKHPQEFRHYRVNSSTIYDAIRSLQHQPHTPENLTNALEHLYKSTDPTRFLVIEFKAYHVTGPHWIREVGKSIETHRTQIENALNQRNLLTETPHTTLRLATHDHTLYIWHHQHAPDAWLTLLRHEYFYFDTTDTKNLLINKACSHLNTNHYELGKIIPQLTNHPTERQHPESPLADLSRRKPYILGETLNFLLDASGHDFYDIQLFITRLGRGTHGFDIGGIHNPIFLRFEELDEFRARAVAIALSDGHIHHENKQFTYIEKSHDRQDYVKQLFRNNLGDIHFSEDSRTDRINMPVVIGRLLEQWGVPAGDKHLTTTFRLPDHIRNGSPIIKRAYIQEVIPEDGSFVLSSNKTKFVIKRATILDAGEKTETYQFQSKIPQKQIEFIRNHGTERQEQIRDEPIRTVTTLTIGELRKLIKDATNPLTNRQAKQLMITIENHPCQLLDDERNLIQSLGIKMNRYARTIQIHETGRVSVTWEIETSREDDAISLALQATPAAGPKRHVVEQWLKDQGIDYRTFRQKLNSLESN